MDRPLIAITAMSGRFDGGIGPQPSDVLERDYTAAVARAGGSAVIVPLTEAPHAAGVIARVDGLILSGGGDVDPALYRDRGSTDPAAREVSRERDELEMALVEAAVARRLPILGICRGLQVLNVCFGGTLVADLNGHLHRKSWSEPVHGVSTAPGSVLHALLGEHVRVNSLHHQAADVLGVGLRPVAWADDGTIEAIIHESLPGVIGVQWHPEKVRPRGGDPDPIFSWLVGQAAHRALDERPQSASPGQFHLVRAGGLPTQFSRLPIERQR